MKNVMVLVHDDDGQTARLQTALNLARALEGHLSCVDVTPTLVYGGNAYAGFGDPILLNDERETEARNKVEVTKLLEREGVQWDWVQATGDVADCLLEAGGLADLIVVSQALDEIAAPDMFAIASRLVMQARTPLVAVPEEANDFNAKGRALIAWDGQESAAATMRATIPLLQLASAVHLFMARDGAEKIEAEPAVTYLKRHGIYPSVEIIDDGLHHADQLIVKEAQRWGADYLVMGAYNHGRMAEIFGGVTKRMLKHSKIPMVIGH